MRLDGIVAAFLWFLSLVWVVCVSVLGVFVSAVDCDDGCHRGSGEAHWTLVEEAWQWDAIRNLALANLGLGFLVLAQLLVASSIRTVAVTYAVQLAAVLGLAALVLDGQRYDVGLVTAALVLSGAALPFAVARLAATEAPPNTLGSSVENAAES